VDSSTLFSFVYVPVGEDPVLTPAVSLFPYYGRLPVIFRIRAFRYPVGTAKTFTPGANKFSTILLLCTSSTSVSSSSQPFMPPASSRFPFLPDEYEAATGGRLRR